MPRNSRKVLPGYPHHIVQRGSRSQIVFFSDDDRNTYLKLLYKKSKQYNLDIWAYCLMDNHVHLIAVPERKESLSSGVGSIHKGYACLINKKQGWKGHLWQERFYSFPLDSRYLYSAVRYVERNPVRAGIVKRAEDYKWSSAYAHVRKRTDSLLTDFFFTSEILDWAAYLNENDDPMLVDEFQKHLVKGNLLGNHSVPISL